MGGVITGGKIHMPVLDAVRETLSVPLYGFKVHVSFHWHSDNDLPTALIPESHCNFLWKVNILFLSFLHKIRHSLNPLFQKTSHKVSS